MIQRRRLARGKKGKDWRRWQAGMQYGIRSEQDIDKVWCKLVEYSVVASERQPRCGMCSRPCRWSASGTPRCYPVFRWWTVRHPPLLSSVQMVNCQVPPAVIQCSDGERSIRNESVIISRAAFAERCPRPKSYRPLFRRHRSSHVQRSTADIPALDFMLGPATHWSHTTPACRHRSSPRT